MHPFASRRLSIKITDISIPTLASKQDRPKKIRKPVSGLEEKRAGRKNRSGLELPSSPCIVVIIGFIVAVGIYVGSGSSGVGIVGAGITFLVSIGIARAVWWMAFHGRKPEWSDVPEK